ncbi:MAG: hypothetical protein AB2A00_04010 [Myxococcota bacterium]
MAAAFFLAPDMAEAHRGHKKTPGTAGDAGEMAPAPAVEPAPSPAATTDGAREAAAPPPAQPSQAPLPAADERRVEPAPITLEAMVEHAAGHPHNKLVHVPIGFALALMLLLLWRPTADDGTAQRLMALGGALGAVAAAVTGWSQGRDFAAGAPELSRVLEVHRWLGVANAVLNVVVAGLFLLPRPPGRAVRRIAAGLLLGMLTLAGLFGGWLATEG